MATAYSSTLPDCLFICDIRTADHNYMEDTKNEDCVLKDNELVINSVLKLKPKKSMLKFRCLYPDKSKQKTTKFFKGEIFLQQ